MLKSRIKSIVEERGIQCIKNPLLVNELADYKAYEECICAKFILKTIIEEKYTDTLCRLIGIGAYTDTVAKRIIEDLYSKFGFRKDAAFYVINSLIYALGFPELPVENPQTPSSNSKHSNKEDNNHIIFSGISLSHSLSEIEKHLLTRGFKTAQSKPYQCKMAGTFCGIDDVELFINGSPLGVTKNITIKIENQASSLHFNYSNDLYKLIHNKYGMPYFSLDPLSTIGSDFDHYCRNILEYNESVEDYKDILDFKWKVTGGEIELNWIGERLYLIYTDTDNTNSAEQHQKQFNLDSI